jgi:hypothetical protein
MHDVLKSNRDRPHDRLPVSPTLPSKVPSTSKDFLKKALSTVLEQACARTSRRRRRLPASRLSTLSRPPPGNAPGRHFCTARGPCRTSKTWFGRRGQSWVKEPPDAAADRRAESARSLSAAGPCTKAPHSPARDRRYIRGRVKAFATRSSFRAGLCAAEAFAPRTSF